MPVIGIGIRTNGSIMTINTNLNVRGNNFKSIIINTRNIPKKYHRKLLTDVVPTLSESEGNVYIVLRDGKLEKMTYNTAISTFEYMFDETYPKEGDELMGSQVICPLMGNLMYIVASGKYKNYYLNMIDTGKSKIKGELRNPIMPNRIHDPNLATIKWVTIHNMKFKVMTGYSYSKIITKNKEDIA